MAGYKESNATGRKIMVPGRVQVMVDNTARNLKRGNADTEKLRHKLASDQDKHSGTADILMNSSNQW